MDQKIQKRVNEWLDGPFDDATKAEIKTLLETDPHAIEAGFSETLSFGTGGMRAIMGPGPGRLNIYTIRAATQGLANYLHKEGAKPLRVAIAYDCRRSSKEFAQEAAAVLAASGIEVFLAAELRPTPFVSFICREKKCSAAIMITASHNPPEYNGYKVYWSDGAQVVAPHAEGIIKEVEAIEDLSTIPTNPSGAIHLLTKEDDANYITAIAASQKCPEKNKQHGHTLKIVYTSLHGAGITLMEKALHSWHFPHVKTVATQVVPDAEFSTVDSPNPENRESLTLGEKLLTETGSDILIANDPDADRIACVVMHEGSPVMLNGNETAVVLLSHILRHKQTLPKNGAVVASVVTTHLLKEMAHHHSLAYFDVLTGFKYIGEKMRDWDETKAHTFVFGAEQSYGYLASAACRDKDGIAIGCLLCEAALEAKLRGKTLIDTLDAVYEEHGVYREAETAIAFSHGARGKKEMDEFMEKNRKTPPQSIAGAPLACVRDYRKGLRGLPPTNMLSLHLEDGSYLILRPSGTEPKLKIYAFTRQKVRSSVAETKKRCDTFLQHMLKFYDSR